VEIVRPRVSYADLERAPEDGRRYELYDEAGTYVLVQRASGDDEVRSAVVGGAPLLAGRIFP
jgi:hypothetical protein